MRAHQGLGVRGCGQGLGQSVLSWAPRLRWGHWGLDAGAVQRDGLQVTAS